MICLYLRFCFENLFHQPFYPANIVTGTPIAELTENKAELEFLTTSVQSCTRPANTRLLSTSAKSATAGRKWKNIGHLGNDC
jgi:hypothetical protein